jgi:hypothetical protein
VRVIELGGPADAVPAVREGRRALAFEGAEHEVRVPLAGIAGAILTAILGFVAY